MISSVEVRLGDVLPNPFKKYINDGKLNDSILQKLREGFEQTQFHENLLGRKNKDGQIELVYGHHRLAVAKQVYGEDFRMKIGIVQFSDEQMLIDLIRENLTHRDTDFHDTEESIVLARDWLKSKSTNAEQFSNSKWKGDKVGGKANIAGSESLVDSSYSIAKFLSKNGKVVSDDTVRNYLRIHDNLVPELHEKIVRKNRKPNLEGIGVKFATAISSLEKPHQVFVEKKLESAPFNIEKKLKLVSAFKKASQNTKEKILSGKESLVDVELLVQKEVFSDPSKIPIGFGEAVGILNKMFRSIGLELDKNTASLIVFEQNKVFEKMSDEQKKNLVVYLLDGEEKAKNFLSVVQRVKKIVER